MKHRAFLINAPTQARKTQYFLNFTSSEYENAQNTLMIFLTQSNNLMAVDQIIYRMKDYEPFAEIFQDIHISNTFEKVLYDLPLDNTNNFVIADFWNSRNIKNIYEFFDECPIAWDRIIIAIDETEMGGSAGVYSRMRFVAEMEKRYFDYFNQIDLILITATVPNLSRALLHVSDKYESEFENSIVYELFNKPITQYHFVEPHKSYVGPSWFLEDIKRWVKLSVKSTDSRDVKRDKALEAIYDLPKSAKRLSLIVLSTRKNDHDTIGDQLLHMGYNVIVEMNSENDRDYKIKYLKEKTGAVKSWYIPYKLLEKMADDGKMKTLKNADTGLNSRLDLSLSHIIAASCFMGTSYEDILLDDISNKEKLKLKALSRRIETNDKNERPDDFPQDPHVAIVTGFMAGRGITFQNAQINFVCSSFAFIDVNDSAQWGANNAQRFGRSCGILLDVYQKNQPILIATKNILMNAVANEKLLYEKAKLYKNGDMIVLKDLISLYDWKNMKKSVSEDLDSHIESADIIDGVKIKNLLKYMQPDNQTVIGRMVKALYAHSSLEINEFKKIINYSGSDEQFYNNIANGCGIKAAHGHLWNIQKEHIKINQKIFEIISKHTNK